MTDVGSQSNLQCPDLHHWSRTAAEACADQLAAGTDIIADGLPNGLVTAAAIEAVKQGLLKESDLDRAVKGMFDIRFRLGLLDPAKFDPYRKIDHSVVGCPAHLELSRQAARESIVLMKNSRTSSGKLLPIDLARVKKIAVLGPFADRTDVGPYGSTPIGGKVKRDEHGKWSWVSVPIDAGRRHGHPCRGHSPASRRSGEGPARRHQVCWRSHPIRAAPCPSWLPSWKRLATAIW